MLWAITRYFLGRSSTFSFFFNLFGDNNAGDQIIVECSVEESGKKSLSIPPKNCHDLDSTACNILFPKTDQTRRDNADVYKKLLI